jgi:hypothetical protein
MLLQPNFVDPNSHPNDPINFVRLLFSEFILNRNISENIFRGAEETPFNTIKFKNTITLQCIINFDLISKGKLFLRKG